MNGPSGGDALRPAVHFRQRNGWEAADMGIFLWRANWLSMFLFLGIPAALLSSLRFLPVGGRWLAALSIWWFKPLLDRFCLHVLSVRFFESRAAPGRLFRGLGRTLFRGLAGDLLWRRFSPSRSARLPLRVLERLKGKNYRRRKGLLARNGLDFGFPLTAICLGLWMALILGEYLFFYSIADMVQSGGVGNPGDFFFQPPDNWSALFFWFDMLFFWFTLTLIETLYTAMGFGLYINARVETEGWDIELLFKQCVERAAHKGR